MAPRVVCQPRQLCLRFRPQGPGASRTSAQVSWQGAPVNRFAIQVNGSWATALRRLGAITNLLLFVADLAVGDGGFGAQGATQFCQYQLAGYEDHCNKLHPFAPQRPGLTDYLPLQNY